MTDGTAFQPIERPTTQDSIIEQFQLALMQGELQPGQRLPSEVDLGKRWGVGRSTVRSTPYMQ
jgi:GntR family transcriptional regulator, transcriptional repressor for pyruvate dehydrogenase complex